MKPSRGQDRAGTTWRRARGYALVAVAATGWGTWPLFLRHAEATSTVHPALEAAVAMSVLVLLGTVLLRGDRVAAKGTRADWALVGLLGAADAGNVVLFFAAYQRTSVAIAVLTHYLTPLLVALLAPLVVAETWRARTAVSVIVSFAGLAVLLSPWSRAPHPGDLAGGLLGAGSALCYACNVLVTKRLVPRFSGSELVSFHGVVAVPLLVALVPASSWAMVDPRGWAWLIAGALVSGGFAGLCFVWGIRSIDASQASTLTLLEPLIATLSAWLFLGEALGPSALAGGALILSGAALTMAPRRGARKSAD